MTELEHKNGEHYERPDKRPINVTAFPTLLPASEIVGFPEGLYTEARSVHLLTAAANTTDSKYENDVNAGFKTVFVLGLTDKDKAAIGPQYQNVQDFLSLLTGYANGKVAEKINEGKIGSGDFAKQSDYRAQLMNAYILAIKSYISLDADQALKQRITCNAKDLHVEIIKNLLSGFIVPDSAMTAFEGIFDSLKQTISKIGVVDGRHLFLIVKTFSKGNFGIETKLRIFLFAMTSETSKVTSGKSSSTNIDINLNFSSTQYSWNNRVYEQSKDQIDKQLVDDGKKTLSNLPQVDVDL